MVPEKSHRVYHFHHSTLETLAEVVAAVGLNHPSELHPHHISKRISQNEVKTYDQLYPTLSPGELLSGTENPQFAIPWSQAQAHTFAPLGTVQE